MKIKTSIFILISTIVILSCTNAKHNRTTILLEKFQDINEIIYETSNANFHISSDEFQNYFQNRGFFRPSRFSYYPFLNDSTQSQFMQYAKSFNSNSIAISDTLATKMVEKEGLLMRAEDQTHSYYNLSRDIRWIIIEFAYHGKLKVFNKQSNSFVKEIIVDEVDTKSDSQGCEIYSEYNITLKDKSILLSNFWGCNSG